MHHPVDRAIILVFCFINLWKIKVRHFALLMTVVYFLKKLHLDIKCIGYFRLT